MIDFILELSDKSGEEAKVFPIDREFIIPYIPQIREFNAIDFIYSNLELMSSLYVNQLFVCLPEVWENITADDIIRLVNDFTKVESYFSLLQFTYKYLEVDIISLILNAEPVRKYKDYEAGIILYIKRQWNVLIKSEGDLEDFEDGFIEVDYNEWLYIKQKLLIDPRVAPAVTDLYDMKKYIIKRFGDVAL